MLAKVIIEIKIARFFIGPRCICIKRKGCDVFFPAMCFVLFISHVLTTRTYITFWIVTVMTISYSRGFRRAWNLQCP